MKNTRKTRFFSLLLCCLMLVGILPMGQVAYATGDITVNVAYDSSTCTASVSWDAVPGVTRYLVSLENDNESGTGWSQAARTQNKSITTTSCTFNKDDYFLKYGNGGDNYKVSVRALDASNNILASGESAVFQTGLSPLSAPTVTFDSTGVATWTAVSGADRYYYICYQDSSSHPVESGRQSELTVDFSPVLIPEHEYYVQVNAIGNGTTTRNSKEVESNTITVAGSMENITGFTWSGTTLSWNSFSGADSYDFRVTKKVGGVYVQQGAVISGTVNNYYDFEGLFSTYGEGNYIIEVAAVRGSLNLSKFTESPAFDFVLTSAYTVSFNTNGHGTAPAPQNVYSGNTATKPADPTAFGWKFGGWYKEAACTNAFDFSTPITGNITLYAKWTQLFNVTFDMRGHGTAPTYQTVESGNTAAKPDDPSEDGWIFRGWYTEAACTNAFDFSTPITSNIVLYAKWTERVNTHGIIFDNGGGTGTKDSEIGIHMATYICPPADTFGPPSADKEFDQWEVTIGKAEPQRMDPGESFYLFGDTTIKALWKDKSTTAFAFTTQPTSGAAKKTEDYTYSWALNDTPDSILIQAFFDDSWHDGSSLMGKTSDTVSYAATISKYRIKATKGTDTIYSDEFTVTWLDDSATSYTVTFDANGHGTAPAAQTVEDGKTATKPADPTASGWTFGGWYQDATCSIPFDFTTPITANITLYAKWTEDSVLPGTYTVKFDANGHGTAPDMQEIESGKTATKPADPTATGWIFGGWYKEAACTNAFDFATPITGNITLYAKWTEEGVTPVPTTYTVSFDANGHGTAPAAQSIESGKTAAKPADPTATGWKFGGWYQDATCNIAFDFATPITANITLYAKWTKDSGGEEPPVPITYTVTFDANGHGTAPSAQTVESGKTVTKPADPTASGWTFGGWYKEAACNNAFNFSTPITGNITLYAKWTKVAGDPVPTTKYTITYVLNGGTLDGKTGTVIVSVEDGATITLPKPTRSGYTFDYWEGSRYAAGASYKVTGDHTFTAQWKANSTGTDGKDTSPKTGDNSHIGLWIALMATSLIGLGGVSVYGKGRKRRTSR